MITKLKRYIGFHFSQLLYILFVYLFSRFPRSASPFSAEKKVGECAFCFRLSPSLSFSSFSFPL